MYIRWNDGGHGFVYESARENGPRLKACFAGCMELPPSDQMAHGSDKARPSGIFMPVGWNHG